MSKCCKHCQEKIPAQRQDDFCCNGCSTAYRVIHKLGLDTYYARRELNDATRPPIPETRAEQDLSLYIQEKNGEHTLHLMVDGLHCAACVWVIETVLQRQAGVTQARINMTTRRLVLSWKTGETTAEQLLDTVYQLGYRLLPYDPQLLQQADQKRLQHLMLCMAVAGFAAANVMLLSVSLWAGADLEEGTRQLLQAFSSLIVLPAALYAGQPFFSSAYNALKHKRLNMDVPITLAVLTTLGISVYDMLADKGETYFESAIMLLFFLLIGRFLDERVRGQSRSAAEHLMHLQIVTANVVQADGSLKSMTSQEIKVGDILLIARGERLPADGTLYTEHATLDTSTLTGESLPRTYQQGDVLHAGCLNTSNSFQMKVTATGEKTQLAHISQLVETATQAKNKYTLVADKVAKSYAPFVHTLSALTFILWYGFLGASLHQALLYATAVLIVTCPCALALAVPAVQVAVISRLLKRGVIVTSASALERLKDIQAIVFDKTGTLTTGELSLVSKPDQEVLQLAARVAAGSQHPLSQALVKSVGRVENPFEVTEYAGLGVSANFEGEVLKLGSQKFCDGKKSEALKVGQTDVWFKQGERPAVQFILSDALRDDAAVTIDRLSSSFCDLYLCSGDTNVAVKHAGMALNMQKCVGEMTPQKKHAFLEKIKEKQTLMCGDGINDAPSLAAAHVGLTMANGTDIAKLSADIILQNNRLADIPLTYTLAKAAHKAVQHNFAFSFAYNVVTVPLAVAGFITPLWAAVFMSASSLTVVLNALRLSYKKV